MTTPRKNPSSAFFENGQTQAIRMTEAEVDNSARSDDSWEISFSFFSAFQWRSPQHHDDDFPRPSLRAVSRAGWQNKPPLDAWIVSLERVVKVQGKRIDLVDVDLLLENKLFQVLWLIYEKLEKKSWKPKFEPKSSSELLPENNEKSYQVNSYFLAHKHIPSLLFLSWCWLRRFLSAFPWEADVVRQTKRCSFGTIFPAVDAMRKWFEGTASLMASQNDTS